MDEKDEKKARKELVKIISSILEYYGHSPDKDTGDRFFDETSGQEDQLGDFQAAKITLEEIIKEITYEEVMYHMSKESIKESKTREIKKTKITKQSLKQMIKEELRRVLSEMPGYDYYDEYGLEREQTVTPERRKEIMAEFPKLQEKIKMIRTRLRVAVVDRDRDGVDTSAEIEKLQAEEDKLQKQYMALQTEIGDKPRPYKPSKYR